MKKPTTWIIIFLLICSFLLLSENRDLSHEIDLLRTKIDALDEEYEAKYEQQYKEGYDAGFSEGQLEGGTFYPVNYYEMDDMSSDEIIEYLENKVDDKIWLGENARNFGIYTFQLGYSTHKNGTWNDIVDELINGYTFTDSETEYFFSQLG